MGEVEEIPVVDLPVVAGRGKAAGAGFGGERVRQLSQGCVDLNRMSREG